MAAGVPDHRGDRTGMPPAILVAGFVAVFVVIGVVLALLTRQVWVLVLVVLVSVVLALAAWLWSTALSLRLVGAKPADERDHARLDNLTDGLSVAVGVTKPDLYVVADPNANALTVGRDQRSAALVVTTGLLEHVSRIELEGVVARELNRIKSGEVGRRTLLVGLVGVPAAMSDYGLRYWWGPVKPAGASRSAGRGVIAALSLVCMPLAPLTAMVMHASVGPDDEGFADLDGVDVTRYPPGLAGALGTMSSVGTAVTNAGRATAHLWIAEPMPGPDRAPSDEPGFAARRLAALDIHTPLQHRIDTLTEL
jgi:heat shock protein HtpX